MRDKSLTFEGDETVTADVIPAQNLRQRPLSGAGTRRALSWAQDVDAGRCINEGGMMENIRIQPVFS
ncbi:hypothetical protein J4E08_11425 [Sagittula sp. NFXS13]|uniref:hypothetical protein n=1 Tax=Sagittula sp. NFXS13 TaxID=2819095 RepID=UPI0032DEAF21